MKIAYLTAGAAGMFCGSCLHDNALARAWIRMGHDCVLIPVYTPIRTDEQDVSIDRVFMGGINVYLQQQMPWLAYLPSWMDSVLNQPWLINPLTKNAGKTSPALLGALTVSMLRGLEGRQRKEFERLHRWLQSDIQPDMIVFTNLLIGGGIPHAKKTLNCRVFVTLQGDDIFLDSLPEPYRTKSIEAMRQLVSQVDGFLVHSRDYAARMANLIGIPDSKIHIVPLGIDVSGFRAIEVGQAPRRPLTIGYLARMAPEKGLHKLIDAFIAIADQMTDKDVRLKLAGWMGPQHDVFWREQQSKLAKAGLEKRYEYVGSIDRDKKAEFLRSIDLFSVPTTYSEPKGLFLLEAIAAGVPYLQPSHGAFPELHERLKAIEPGRELGQLFQPDSKEDYCAKMIAMLNHPGPKMVSPGLLDEIDIVRHAERVLAIFESATNTTSSPPTR